jgi:predicted RNA-binding protein associated with RNAse of E/G family
VVVRLVKPVHADVEYPAVVLSDDGTHIIVRGPWAEPAPRDLGFAVFEPGDIFTEHYWRDRWYSVKEVRDAGGALKGWYCDVTRPVRVESGAIVSEDLYLDLWASADRATILRLDEADFEASALARADPAAAARASAALDELERLAAAGFSDIAGVT